MSQPSRCPPNYPWPKMVMTTCADGPTAAAPAGGQNRPANRQFSAAAANWPVRGRCASHREMFMRGALWILALVVPIVAIATPARSARGGRQRRRSPPKRSASRSSAGVQFLKKLQDPQKGTWPDQPNYGGGADAAVHAGPAQLRLRAGRRGGSQGPGLFAQRFSRPPPTPTRCRRWCFAPPSRSRT